METPSLEASLHLPRHGRVSSGSGSRHVWEQRHGSTTQPPERGILHTHNNLFTHTAYRHSQVQACQHSHTAFSSALTCISCFSPGLGLMLHGHSHVHSAAELFSQAHGREQSWGNELRDCTSLIRSGTMSAQEGEPRGTHAPSRQTALGARCLKMAMGRPLESLPLLGYTTGVSALRATYRQVCSCVH